MITQAIMGVFLALVEFVVSLFPDGTAPDWLSSGGQMLSQLVGKASGLAPWFPFPLASTVLLALFVCASAGFLIKVVRMVGSFFTGGGGSAA